MIMTLGSDIVIQKFTFAQTISQLLNILLPRKKKFIGPSEITCFPIFNAYVMNT